MLQASPDLDQREIAQQLGISTCGSTSGVAYEVNAFYNSIIKAGTWKAGSIKVIEAAKVIESSQRYLNIAFVN
jgi:UDP-N-acetyl-D-galactosamine dehydrogenase